MKAGLDRPFARDALVATSATMGTDRPNEPATALLGALSEAVGTRLKMRVVERMQDLRC
jgi:hypothetical protein